MAPRLFIIGTNHRLSPAALRERFALVEDDLTAMLGALYAAGAREAVLLATCDRIELITSEPATLAQFVPLVARRAGYPAAALDAVLYRHEGAAALCHLFAVASGLDSHVLGDGQVLGQVRAAHRIAAELGLVGPALETVFSGAFACARRVRRETPAAARSASLAAAAARLARDIHGALDRCGLLLIGPSDLGALMAEQFHRDGLRRIMVCGTAARVGPVAAQLEANHCPLEEIDDALAAADVVITALGNGRTVLSASRVAAALRRRPRRAIFVIDAAVPPDAEPAVNALDGAFLYDLADLERWATAAGAIRDPGAGEAWQVVEDEVAGFRARAAARQAVPAVVALRRHAEGLRRQVLAERGCDAAAATRLLVNRLLHDPSEVLRDLAAGGAGDAEAIEALVRRLFRLDRSEEAQ